MNTKCGVAFHSSNYILERRGISGERKIENQRLIVKDTFSIYTISELEFEFFISSNIYKMRFIKLHAHVWDTL